MLVRARYTGSVISIVCIIALRVVTCAHALCSRHRASSIWCVPLFALMHILFSGAFAPWYLVGRNTSLMLCVDASAPKKKKPKEKKFRKVSLHNVFVSAVMDAMHGNPSTFKAIPGFKKTVSKEAMDKFAVDFEPVVTALNESGERTTDDMKNLIRNRLKELGVEQHEAFEGLEARPCCLPACVHSFHLGDK